MPRWLVGLALGAAALSAQEVTVYSEFTRIDPFGKVVRADRGSAPPREILSPAIPRAAFSSFRLVVEGPPGAKFTLAVAQNPENAVAVAAYRERYTRIAGEWIPDALEPLILPYDGQLNAVEGQTAQSFWIDMRAPRDAPVRRIKVEPQVYIDEGWLRYPMEVRVTKVVLRGEVPASGGASGAAQPTSASALVALRQVACGRAAAPVSGNTVRSLVARNAAQDFRLAGSVLPKGLPAAFCTTPGFAFAASEDYLEVRDLVFGALEP